MAYKRSNVSKKSNRKNSRRSSKRVQRGGDGQGREYAYGLPIQYFGGKLNRYFPAGSPELQSPDSSYGKTIATSFGKNVPELYAKNFVGPDLAPHHKTIGVSGIQTGGRRKQRQQKRQQKSCQKKCCNKKSQKKQNKRNKRRQSHKKNRRGGFVDGLMREAGKLVVPVGLVAGRELLRGKNNKKSSSK